MTSKKIKPLASLFQQWSSQQESSQSPQSYRILLQSTNGLSTRIKAAEAVENPQLYQRAGVRTPAESAIRDGLGGYAWLEHLVQLALNSSCHIVWVSTKTQPSPITLKLLGNESDNATVIQAAVDPWSWDEDCMDLPSLNNLQELHARLKGCIQRDPNTVLVWESLTPLIAVHGYETVLRFLTSFDNCFQIWPIQSEILSPLQHQALEDASQALLCLQGGEMTMIRQGIRERGNILRKMLPFRLDGDRLVELENEEEPSTIVTGEVINADLAPLSESIPSVEKTQQQRRAGAGSSRKIQLKLEEGDGPKKTIPPATTIQARPRIYLQDDDPEFDDMDEEDPDDDLDI